MSDTIAARLDAVRGDALYATVLFLFLGLPGAALTLAITASGAGQRRSEQALLRVRGASARRITGLAAAEALLVSVGELPWACWPRRVWLGLGFRSGAIPGPWL